MRRLLRERGAAHQACRKRKDFYLSLEFAKQLRKRQTEAEECLWRQLRAHRFLGLKFRRQKPIGVYIVDFICHEHHLIIEVDGGQHQQMQKYDQQITNELIKAGYKVLRFWNNEVLQETQSVLEAIRLAVVENVK